MKQYLFIMLIISGCCSYDKNDFEFTNAEVKHVSSYKIGDTIYFQSNLNDTDTITIIDLKTERNENCGRIMAPKPINGKWLQIKHLPIDKWHGTAQTGDKIETVYQELFWITKSPTDKKTEYFITYKDFYSRPDTVIGVYHSGTITLNDLKVSNYYIVEHGWPERAVESKSIRIVYWTDQYGLTAYKSKDGEIWTRKN